MGGLEDSKTQTQAGTEPSEPSYSGLGERREVGKSQGQNPGKLLGFLDEPAGVAGDTGAILSKRCGGLKSGAFTTRKSAFIAVRLV